MKKIIAVVLALVMLAAVITGCAKKEQVPENLDLNAVYQSILDAQGDKLGDLVLFEETNPDLIKSFYDGLETVELKQQVLYMHPVTGAPTEICLVETTNADDAKKVADIFTARIALGASDEGYPENAVIWKNNAVVQTAGNYVAMIVLGEGFTIPENVFTAK